MLDVLFGSKARVALLARMLLQPEDELHLSDLFRQTGFAPRSIQLEADRLVSLGVLNERRSGNRQYLSANIRHSIQTRDSACSTTLHSGSRWSIQRPRDTGHITVARD